MLFPSFSMSVWLHGQQRFRVKGGGKDIYVLILAEFFQYAYAECRVQRCL